eukprot:TRINITY_DN796_c1_g1_i1.p1 TRINITY_DN796_c1_g1~~TRINITY_DN796_c1_g1_i1.p1  ORF type:complete len:408 (+),score=110.35 TRINITY_DN796_c1_g1_i1:65-1288(+)
MRSVAFVSAAVASVQAIDNGYGMTPPMGWRSWNCYGGGVNQDLMESVMDKMAERNRTVDGKLTSYADLGYTAVGLDDNWQACGAGIDKSFHDAQGNPIVNTKRFPSMKAMVDHGHSLNLKVGWYANNCICKEDMFNSSDYIALHMKNSVKAIVDAGFDGVKLDSCGQFKNLTWWGQLLNETGRPVMIENCHQGGTVPGQTTGDAPCSGTTMPSDCPYNFYRSSRDIQNNWGDVMHNLNTTTKYQGNPPLSRPGAWAYPDMLEVGRMPKLVEDKTHFGAWCIVSSPLILGHNVNNDTTVDRIWPIISNKEAIAVNQAWEGHPGRKVKENGNWQIWAKDMPNKAQAVFLLSNDDGEITVDINFSDLGLSGTVSVRDIWERKDSPDATDKITIKNLPSHDSMFLLLTPKN